MKRLFFTILAFLSCVCCFSGYIETYTWENRIKFYPVPLAEKRIPVEPGTKIAFVAKYFGTDASTGFADIGLSEFEPVYRRLYYKDPIMGEFRFLDEFSFRKIKFDKIKFDKCSFLVAVEIFNRKLREQMPWTISKDQKIRKVLACVTDVEKDSPSKTSVVDFEMENVSPFDVALALQEKGRPLVLKLIPLGGFIFTDDPCLYTEDSRMYYCNNLVFNELLKRSSLENKAFSYSAFYGNLTIYSNTLKEQEALEKVLDPFYIVRTPCCFEDKKEEDKTTEPGKNIWKSIEIPHFEMEDQPIEKVANFIQDEARRVSGNQDLKVTVMLDKSSQISITMSCSDIPADSLLNYLCRLTDISFTIKGAEIVIHEKDVYLGPKKKCSAALTEKGLKNVLEVFKSKDDLKKHFEDMGLLFVYRDSVFKFDKEKGIIEVNIPEYSVTLFENAVKCLNNPYPQFKMGNNKLNPGTDAVFFCTVKNKEQELSLDKVVPVSCRKDVDAAFEGWIDWCNPEIVK